MSKILSFNFSIEPFTIAFLDNNSKYQVNQKDYPTFSENIDTILMDISEKLDMSLKTLDAIGIITGPGNYTGLRVSVTHVKTLAQIYKIPVFSFNALEATLFNHLNTDNVYLTLLPARSNEVNCALVAVKNRKTTILTAPFSWSENQLSNGLKQLKIPFIGQTPSFSNNDLNESLSEKLQRSNGDALSAAEYINSHFNTLTATSLDDINISYSHAPFIVKKEKKSSC